MTGRDLNGKYSICKAELPDDGDSISFVTLKWGYDTEQQAISALKKVASETGVPLDDLVVVGAVFARDLGLK
jgi:hypothetical protein